MSVFALNQCSRQGCRADNPCWSCTFKKDAEVFRFRGGPSRFERLMIDAAELLVDAAFGIENRIAAIEASLATLTKEGAFTMSALDDLTAQVSATTNAEASVVVLLQGLRKQLDDAGTDGPKLEALAAQLKASQDAIAAAVVQNTSAAAPPAPTP